MKKTRFFPLLFLFTLLTEVLIALFVHDRFVRPYLGDVLAVVAVYALVRIFLPRKPRFLSLPVFLFALLTECMQGLRLTDRLGIRSPFLRTLLGSTFDTADILCYGAGCLLLYLLLERKPGSGN